MIKNVKRVFERRKSHSVNSKLRFQIRITRIERILSIFSVFRDVDCKKIIPLQNKPYNKNNKYERKMQTRKNLLQHLFRKYG